MTGRGPVRVTVYVETDKVGSTVDDVVEIDRAVWEEMAPSERIERLEELAVAQRNEFSEYGWSIDDPDDDPRQDRPRGRRLPKPRP